MKPQHTFGGSPLDRYTIEYELGDPSGLGDPGSAGDPAADGLEPPAAAPEQWAMSQEQFDELQGNLSFLMEQEQRRQQMFAPQQQQEPQGPSFYEDPDGWLEHRLAERLAPLQEFQEEIKIQEGSERAKDMLSDLASRGGDFDHDLAMLRAEQILPQMKRQYGDTWQAAEKALEAAAEQQRKWEQARDQAAVQQHTNHITTLAGAPGEPGSTYGGAQQRTMPNYRTGGSVTDNLLGR